MNSEKIEDLKEQFDNLSEQLSDYNLGYIEVTHLEAEGILKEYMRIRDLLFKDSELKPVVKKNNIKIKF